MELKSYKETGNRRLHRVVAEKALGKPLPLQAEVHHADLTKSIDSPLVICQDSEYDKLLHTRTTVLRAGGNPNTDSWCSYKKHAAPLNHFYFRMNGKITTTCKVCNAEKERIRRKSRKMEMSNMSEMDTTPN